MKTTIRLKGVEPDGSIVYVVLKPDGVIKMVTAQNQDIKFGYYVADQAACRFELEDARDSVCDDAVEKALDAMRRHAPNMIWSIFGKEPGQPAFTRQAVDNIAMQACYLLDGYTAKMREEKNESSRYQESNGHTGVVGRLTDLAYIVHRHCTIDPLKSAFDSGELGGVFEYDVTDPMGRWFYENSICTDAEFEAELVAQIKAWL